MRSVVRSLICALPPAALAVAAAVAFAESGDPGAISGPEAPGATAGSEPPGAIAEPRLEPAPRAIGTSTRPGGALPVAGALPLAGDASKLAKEGVALQAKAALRGKNKTCCGYPLVEELGWQLTFYWLAFQEDFLEPVITVPSGNRKSPVELNRFVELYTRDGFFFGRVPERFAWSLRMEGSGVMMDGRVVNYHGPCNFGYGTCFQTLDPTLYPFGRGAGARTLVPFKSVAVDPKLIAIGEPLYLPELDGIVLPDGSRHDGCVRADDTGGAIKKRKMDFFAVTYGNYRMLIDQLLGVGWVTPHIEAPRCEYLRER